jgi:hypothetical protein
VTSTFYTTYVYFIQGVTTRLVKIGMSENVGLRLVMMQQGSPDRLRLLGTVAFRDFREALHIEHRLHVRFANCRAHGEWFRPDAALTKFLQSIDREKLRRLLGGWHFTPINSHTLEAVALNNWQRKQQAADALCSVTHPLFVNRTKRQYRRKTKPARRKGAR